MLRKIVVVCTGNICRSPMAEALLINRLNSSEVRISSAGIAALTAYPADSTAQLVMQEHGFSIANHRAKQATQAMLTDMDLILSLDQTHSDWIRSRFPNLTGRIHKLGRWRNNADVADPYRKPKTAFDEAFSIIEQCVDDWVKRINSL